MEPENDLCLKESCRMRLKEPLGRLVSKKADLKKLLEGREIIAVGDRTAQDLLELGFAPKAAVVDYKIERKPIDYRYTQFRTVFKAKNPPGKISPAAWKELSAALKEKSALLEIDGEEDLLVLPAIAFSKDGTVICYGQPGEGMVVVEVGERTRYKAEIYLEKCFVV